MSSVELLDETVLAKYLEDAVPGFKGPLTVSKFPGGQSNPTFKIDADSGTYILRRQPPGKLLKSAHAADRKFRVLAALTETEVPVAEVYHLCEDSSVIVSMFYLMEFCDGNVYWNPDLWGIEDRDTRTAMYDQMVKTFVILHHKRREIVHCNATEHPTAQCSAQQLLEAFPFETAPRYLLRDRDSIYGERFRNRVKSLGMEDVVTAPRSPWQSPYVERLIGSIRRECLNHVIIFNERHLRRQLKSYATYYHEARTHLSLAKQSPVP